MNTFTCEFCNKSLKTKSTLALHQETANYCLKIRGAALETDFKCTYCDMSFSRGHHLKRHMFNCPEYEVQIATKNLDSYQLKFISQQKKLISANNTIKKQNVQIKKQNDKIIELEKQLEYEKGKLHGYQESKPSNKIVNKNCNTVNSKLSNIQITTIKPFTIESISEALPLYTEACFRNKLHGIMSLIVPMTTLDVNGVIERNIVCTDLARTVCHRLTDDREWLRDDGLSICKDILRLFAPSMTPYINDYKEKFEEAERTLNNESHSLTKSIHYPNARRDFDNYFEILEDVRTDFYTPIIQEFGENYDTLIKNFRDLLKPAVYVRTIAAKD